MPPFSMGETSSKQWCCEDEETAGAERFFIFRWEKGLERCGGFLYKDGPSIRRASGRELASLAGGCGKASSRHTGCHGSGGGRFGKPPVRSGYAAAGGACTTAHAFFFVTPSHVTATRVLPPGRALGAGVWFIGDGEGQCAIRTALV
jgi:hypothetical protein